MRILLTTLSGPQPLRARPALVRGKRILMVLLGGENETFLPCWRGRSSWSSHPGRQGWSALLAAPARTEAEQWSLKALKWSATRPWEPRRRHGQSLQGPPVDVGRGSEGRGAGEGGSCRPTRGARALRSRYAAPAARAARERPQREQGRKEQVVLGGERVLARVRSGGSRERRAARGRRGAALSDPGARAGLLGVLLVGVREEDGAGPGPPAPLPSHGRASVSSSPAT